MPFLLVLQDGFCRFFGRHGSEAAEQSSTIGNAIVAAAAGIGMAGLAFLLVR